MVWNTTPITMVVRFKPHLKFVCFIISNVANYPRLI